MSVGRHSSFRNHTPGEIAWLPVIALCLAMLAVQSKTMMTVYIQQITVRIKETRGRAGSEAPSW